MVSTGPCNRICDISTLLFAECLKIVGAQYYMTDNRGLDSAHQGREIDG